MQFTVVRKGYRPEEVDRVIQDMEKKIEEQERELAEYRNREDALNKMEEKARVMVEQANEAADRHLRETLEELKGIRKDALATRELISAFQEEYNQLLRQYLLRIRSDEFPRLLDRIGALIEKTGGDEEENR